MKHDGYVKWFNKVKLGSNHMYIFSSHTLFSNYIGQCPMTVGFYNSKDNSANFQT